VFDFLQDPVELSQFEAQVPAYAILTGIWAAEVAEYGCKVAPPGEDEAIRI
jgi:hypothetical protein